MREKIEAGATNEAISGLFELHRIKLGIVQLELHFDRLVSNCRELRLIRPSHPVFKIVDLDRVTVIQ
jgi:hypothetical protein